MGDAVVRVEHWGGRGLGEVTNNGVSVRVMPLFQLEQRAGRVQHALEMDYERYRTYRSSVSTKTREIIFTQSPSFGTVSLNVFCAQASCYS